MFSCLFFYEQKCLKSCALLFVSSFLFIKIMHTRTICAVLIILCGSVFGFHALNGDLKMKQILRTKFPISLPKIVGIQLQWPTNTPDPRENIEFWTSSNYLDRCISNGTESCGSFIKFMTEFQAEARALSEYTLFKPHYMTWRCPEPFGTSRECSSRCIHHGRYCNWEFINNGYYEGKDVAIENLRQACFFESAHEIGSPWLWWDYVNMFGYRCSMKEMKFNKRCADRVIRSIGNIESYLNHIHT